MAKYNDAVSVTFNDNDGSVGFRINPEAYYDIARHQRIFGVFRTRWILFKRFWRALILAEESALKLQKESVKLWVVNAEIPE